MPVWDRMRVHFGAERRRISAQDYDPWPFVVPSVTLCRFDGAVWVEANSQRYALNGIAEGLFAQRHLSHTDLLAIWRPNPRWSPAAGASHIDIEPLIQAGLRL